MLIYIPCWLSLVRVFFFLNHECLLNFFRCVFCIYWDDHVVFVFSFFDVMCHTDWFAYVEPFLPPLDESKLVIVYDLFNMFLDSVCLYFSEIFYQIYWPIMFFSGSVFFLVLVFGWWWLHRKSLKVFPQVFRMSLRRISIRSPLMFGQFWQQTIWSWTSVGFFFVCFVLSYKFYFICSDQSVQIIYYLNSVLVVSTFLDTCPFLLHCPICWHIVFFCGS